MTPVCWVHKRWSVCVGGGGGMLNVRKGGAMRADGETAAATESYRVSAAGQLCNYGIM